MDANKIQCPKHFQGKERELWFSSRADILRELSLTTDGLSQGPSQQVEVTQHIPGLTLSPKETPELEVPTSTSKAAQVQPSVSKGQSSFKDTPSKSSHSNMNSSGSKTSREDEDEIEEITGLGDPNTPLFKGGDSLMQELNATLNKNPILQITSPNTQHNAL